LFVLGFAYAIKSPNFQELTSQTLAERTRQARRQLGIVTGVRTGVVTSVLAIIFKLLTPVRWLAIGSLSQADLKLELAFVDTPADTIVIVVELNAPQMRRLPAGAVRSRRGYVNFAR
jgi:hypothetical protein